MWYGTAGIAVASFTGLGPTGVWIAVSVLLAALLWRLCRRSGALVPARVMPGLMLMMAGMTWGQYHVDRALDAWLPPALSGITLDIEGRVADLPVTDALGPGGALRSRFHLADARVTGTLPDGLAWPGDYTV